jgi:hypothetical protein
MYARKRLVALSVQHERLGRVRLFALRQLMAHLSPIRTGRPSKKQPRIDLGSRAVREANEDGVAPGT